MVEKKKKEKVCETFEITGGKKEKEQISCGEIEVKEGSKSQQKKLNKTFGIVLIFIGFLVFVFFFFMYLSNKSNEVSYKDVTYSKVRDGKMDFYHTDFPSVIDGEKVTYNVYLRNNPLKTAKKVYLNESDLVWKNLVVVNFSSTGTECNGYTLVAQANFNQILKDGMGLTVGRDENASCDSLGRYMYFDMVSGNETKIEKFGPSCYRLEYTDCEALFVTERVLIEAIALYNKNIK
jgi:hypothetical protein